MTAHLSLLSSTKTNRPFYLFCMKIIFLCMKITLIKMVTPKINHIFTVQALSYLKSWLRVTAFILIALSSLAVLCIDVKECLKAHKIYPDVIDSVPEGKVVIFYGKKKVNYGTPMSIEEVECIPSVTWPADPDSLYTLMVTDPDAPSEQMPYTRQVCFWWVSNIKGSNITTGHTIMSYIGPHPSIRKGAQSYVFVVYKQPGPVTYLEDPEVEENVTKPDTFKVGSIASYYKLGKPVAINLFQIHHPGDGQPAKL